MAQPKRSTDRARNRSKPTDAFSPKALSVARDLEKRIKEGEWEDTGVVPTVRELRTTCGASVETVLGALSCLVRNGVLTRVPGRNRYYIAGHPSIPSLSVGRRRRIPRWKQIGEDIAGAVEDGQYAYEGVLPPAKVLANEYRCAPVTLRRSLSWLERRRVIARRARGTWRVDYGGKSVRGYCFVGASTSFTLFQGNAHAFVAELELELQRRNWGPLSFLLHYRQEDHPAFLRSMGGWFHIRQRTTDEWLSYLGGTHVPGIIVDALEAGTALSLPSGMRAAVLKCDNHAAGSLMARHLRQQGHRDALLFPPLGPPALWARRRLAGLRSPRGGASDQWSVTEVPMPPEPPRGDEAHTEIRQTAAKLYRILKNAGAVPEIIARGMTRGLFQYLPGHRMFPALKEAFERALTTYPATAWVCANDNQALAALQFLRERRIRMPGRIALASFDNSLFSYACDLTSFDFGFARMAHIGLNQLSSNKVGNPPPVRRIEGAVIPRGSTLPFPALGHRRS